MKGFRPLVDHVFIRRIEAEERTPSGTIISDTAKEKPVEGEVLAVGAAARDERGRVVPFTSTSATACCSASGRARS